MAQKLQLILFLGVCLWANDVASSTFKFDLLTRQISRVPVDTDCKGPGLMCDGCKTVYECFEFIPGTYFVEKLYDCGEKSCLKSTGNCTELPNPECDDNLKDYKPTCRQVGLFPHPFDTCFYFLCPSKGAESTKLQCSTGYGYDAYTGLCRIKLADKTCPMLLPPCAIAGQRGGVPGHPAMYYICLNSPTIPMPQYFVCPGNQVYSDTKRTCEEPVHNTGLSDTGKCLARGFFYEGSSCFGYPILCDVGLIRPECL